MNYWAINCPFGVINQKVTFHKSEEPWSSQSSHAIFMGHKTFIASLNFYIPTIAHFLVQTDIISKINMWL